MDNPSIMSHMSLGTNQFEQASAFYKTVLATIGARVFEEFPGAIAFGKTYPEFWVQMPFDGQSASTGNGVHFAFCASSKEQVHAFYDAAIKAGAKDDGPPGPRPMYSDAFYGCYVRDLDGNKIEATFWDESKAPAAH
jgi:catechol 2,3-dioxygenase-like lactoylglutathione lyase family enzyme